MEPAFPIEIRRVRGDVFTEAASPFISGSFMGVSRLRSAPLDTTSGWAGEAAPLRIHVVSTRDPPPAGRRGETPTEVAFPIEIRRVRGDVFMEAAFPVVSGRFGGVSRLRCAPLDTTCSGRGRRIPQKTRRVDRAPLRSTRPVAGGGGSPPTNPRRLDQSPESRLLSGQSGETPTEVAFPIEIRRVRGDVFMEAALPVVSGRFGGVSRLRCASLDTTSGWRGRQLPYKPMSSRLHSAR